MDNTKQNPVVVCLSAGIKKEENLYAYVVDQSGDILEMSPFKDLEAVFKATKNIMTGQTKI
ncbi:MAG: hypothetical protein WCA84_15305 [Ignavibacteriaceae bacterium]